MIYGAFGVECAFGRNKVGPNGSASSASWKCDGKSAEKSEWILIGHCGPSASLILQASWSSASLLACQQSILHPFVATTV